MLDFEQRYPGSVYANDVLFSLGSYYCTKADFGRAREYFGRTDYKALDRSRREQYDVRMGYVAFTDGDYAKAYDYFDRIGSRSRYIDHAIYYKSYIDYAEGRYGRARQGFEQLTRSEAYGSVVPYYLLQIDSVMGRACDVGARSGETGRRSGSEGRVGRAVWVA